MKRTPYNFQRIGARKIQKFGGRALLCDSMGLGKSLQTLLWAKWYLDSGPMAVVCPATIKEHWKREIEDVLPGFSVKVLEGRTPPPLGLRVSPDRAYVINYDILGDPKNPDSWVNYIKAVGPRYVVIDEGHNIKSRDAQRTKSCRWLCQDVPNVVIVSGTPLVNRPAELWTSLNILLPEVFDNFWSYGSRYCGPRRTPWGWQYTGATNLDELHSLLRQTCMIRRLKEEVLTDLPSKTRSVVPLKIDRPKEYKEAESNFIRWLMKFSKSRAVKAAKSEKLVQLGYLRRLAAELKIRSVTQWLDSWLEETDDKLIVFGVHKKVLQPLFQKYRKKAVLVDGGVTGQARQRAIDVFNRHKEVKFFFGNVQAAGVGWSCTSASSVAFVEFPWTPGEVTQAEDRVHGIGRGTGKGVSLYSLVAEKTIEEKLVELLGRKQMVLAHTLDGDSSAGNFDLVDRLAESIMRSRKK